MKVVEKIVGALITLPVGIASLALILFVLFNGIGLLTGFENPSPACNDYKNHSQSNFEYYFFPATKYACKKDAGLFQPALSNLVNWLGEDHK